LHADVCGARGEVLDDGEEGGHSRAHARPLGLAGPPPEYAVHVARCVQGREVEVLDESLPIMDLKTMSEHLGIMLYAPRVGGILLAIFGGLAVLLASIGLYGVVAYAASQRTRELGIRVALGARPGDVVKLVTGQGLALIGVGTAIGLALAFLLTLPLGGLLYGVGPSDPLAFVGVTLLLGAVALAATLVPALRAMRIDPLAALRHE